MIALDYTNMLAPGVAGVEQVPERPAERGAQRDGAERRAADAQHDDVVVPPPRAPDERGALRVQGVVAGQVEEPELSRRLALLERAPRARELGIRPRPHVFGNAAGDAGRKHVGVVESDHRIGFSPRGP